MDTMAEQAFVGLKQTSPMIEDNRLSHWIACGNTTRVVKVGSKVYIPIDYVDILKFSGTQKS